MALQQSAYVTTYHLANKVMVYDYHTKEHSDAVRTMTDICESAETGGECKALMAAIIAGFMSGLSALNRVKDPVLLRKELRKEDYHNFTDFYLDSLPQDMTLTEDEIMIDDLFDVYSFRIGFGSITKREERHLKLMTKTASNAMMYLESYAQVLGLDDHYIYLKDEQTARNIEKKKFYESLGREGITAEEREQLIDEFGGSRLKTRAISPEYAAEIQAEETNFTVDVDVFDSPFLPRYESLKRQVFRTSKKALEYAENTANAIGWRVKSIIVKEVFRDNAKVIKSYDDTFALP